MHGWRKGSLEQMPAIRPKQLAVHLAAQLTDQTTTAAIDARNSSPALPDTATEAWLFVDDEKNQVVLFYRIAFLLGSVKRGRALRHAACVHDTE